MAWSEHSQTWKLNKAPEANSYSNLHIKLHGNNVPYIYFGTYIKDVKNDNKGILLLKTGEYREGCWKNGKLVGACKEIEQPEFLSIRRHDDAPSEIAAARRKEPSKAPSLRQAREGRGKKIAEACAPASRVSDIKLETDIAAPASNRDEIVIDLDDGEAGPGPVISHGGTKRKCEDASEIVNWLMKLFAFNDDPRGRARVLKYAEEVDDMGCYTVDSIKTFIEQGVLSKDDVLKFMARIHGESFWKSVGPKGE
mmetsp:Transcript_24870/g.62165  ORF Transcript_24870/g.62165 Transcript_24870/m.62165 type:complete len:253 (-) Transcript_24870:28-786(-)